MSKERTVPEKVSDWLQAFNAVRAELTPEAFRVMTSLAHVAPDSGFDAARVGLGLDVARIVFANDRQSGVIAAMLTQSGVSRPTITEEPV